MNLALNIRNYNAIISAIGISILLIWALYEKFTIPQLVSRNVFNATIVEIKGSDTKQPNQSFIMLKAKLPNNKFCKLLTQPKAQFKLGRTLSITIEEYDDKSEICFISPKSLNIQ